jgi:hypothetical protein
VVLKICFEKVVNSFKCFKLPAKLSKQVAKHTRRDIGMESDIETLVIFKACVVFRGKVVLGRVEKSNCDVGL